MSNDDKRTDVSPEHVAHVQGLFVKHSQALRAYVMALAPQLDQVDDILQAVFVCVTEKADRFVAGTNFVAWARSVAKIEVLLAARDARRSVRTLSPEIIERLTAVATECESDDDRIKVLAECIEELSPRPRQAIRLRYLNALKPPAIAAQLAIDRKSVNVMLSRARKALRKCIRHKLRMREGR